MDRSKLLISQPFWYFNGNQTKSKWQFGLFQQSLLGQEWSFVYNLLFHKLQLQMHIQQNNTVTSLHLHILARRRETHIPCSKATSTVRAISQLLGSTIVAPRVPLPSSLFTTRSSILDGDASAISVHQSHSQDFPLLSFPRSSSSCSSGANVQQHVRHTPTSSRTGFIPAAAQPDSHSRQASCILWAMPAAFPPARSHLVATRTTSLLGTR